MNPMIFQDTVRSKQEIHVLCGYPSEVVDHKAVQRIDEPKRKLCQTRRQFWRSIRRSWAKQSRKFSNRCRTARRTDCIDQVMRSRTR